MSFTAAASGFVVFLLSVPVVQGQWSWGVTYTSTKICAFKGSTVEIRCTYGYPYSANGRVTTVETSFWFTKTEHDVYDDLKSDSEYTGRVEYHDSLKSSRLRIKDLRESDSAEYKFRFITNHPEGKYHGSPGVSLTVTDPDLQLQVIRSVRYPTWAELRCHSTCYPAGRLSFIWYKNGQKVHEGPSSYTGYFKSEDSYSCAVKGHEGFPSPSVCVRGQTCNRVTYTDRSICAVKGSSVDISCTYNTYEHDVRSKFWFSPKHSDRWQNSSRPEDLSGDSEFAGRVKLLEESGRSTLRITNLTESDSAEYRFKFNTWNFEWRSSLPGTTLTVTDLQLQVIRSTVHQNHTEAELKCHSVCRPADHPSYIWYKNGLNVKEGTSSSSYPVNIYPKDSYSCAVKGHEGFPSPSVYAPKVPSVLVSPSGEIVEGSSVTLTCSSEANPAATYTWYKKNGNPDQNPLSPGPQLDFVSIQSSDSGEFYCTAQNELGKKTSDSISVHVKYGPKMTSVSVNPSGEIVEGSSVTLTCSSDANPAANYTWYKENQTLLQGPEGSYNFTSISSEDRGTYHCQSHNQYGHSNSSYISINVKYGPRIPSVLVSPSGEIVEGSSVTLTCISDANPAANYTWYKKNEASPKASGQTFTITNITFEHSGIYYCEAQNRRGRQNSTLQLTVVAAAWKSTVAIVTAIILLAVILLCVFLWIRRKRASKQTSEPGERSDNGLQLNPVYISAVTQRQPAEQQDELHYASINFSENQEDPLYSNIQTPRPQRQEEEEVQYAAVQFKTATTDPGTSSQEAEEDPSEMYSTVQKFHKNNRT